MGVLGLLRCRRGLGHVLQLRLHSGLERCHGQPRADRASGQPHERRRHPGDHGRADTERQDGRADLANRRHRLARPVPDVVRQGFAHHLGFGDELSMQVAESAVGIASEVAQGEFGLVEAAYEIGLVGAEARHQFTEI